ncbi:MAG: hypothetical protein ABSG43_28880 [Solirubrobacteraceae bacterium]
MDRALPPPPPRSNSDRRTQSSGRGLRHLPSGHEHANHVWLTAALLAVNLTACCRELCPATGASTGPDTRPQRHPAKALRNLLFCIPLRIVRTGRRLA